MFWILLTTPGAGAQTAPQPSGSSQSLNPDISFIADVAAAAFSEEENLQAGAHDPLVNGFNLQQLELSVNKPVDPYFRFDGNIVFSQFGVEIEEVYATTLSLPGRTQVRAGQFLTKFGRANPTHPHSWDFVDQPLALGRLWGGEGNRGLGAEASWLLPLPWSVELVGSQTMANGEATARSFYGANDLGVGSPLHLQSTVAVKQFYPLGTDNSLLWGLSFAGGPNPTGRNNRTEVYGTDLYFKHRPISDPGNPRVVTLTTEALYRRYQVPGDVLSDLSGYGALAWRFHRRWAFGARQGYGSGSWQLSGEEVADPTDPAWVGDRHRSQANVTFWPTEFSRLRLQGNADFAAWLDTPIYAGFLAFEFNVGAHGAHAF